MFSFLLIVLFKLQLILGVAEDMLSGYVCSMCLLQAWLQRYGYLHHTQPNMAVLRSAQTMHSAIAAMQHKYGLNITGTLNKDTVE